jgi:hypothetical protein
MQWWYYCDSVIRILYAEKRGWFQHLKVFLSQIDTRSRFDVHKKLWIFIRYSDMCVYVWIPFIAGLYMNMCVNSWKFLGWFHPYLQGVRVDQRRNQREAGGKQGTTRRFITESIALHCHCCKNLKPGIVFLCSKRFLFYISLGKVFYSAL